MSTSAPWSRARRWAVYLAVLLVLLLLAGTAGALVTVRRSFPQTRGTIEVAGLQDKVEVLRDNYGIPQVYADSTADLFFAQGYVQAQDRFWQMDAWRHITAGRLSELLGKDALDVDKFTRTMGWRRVAQAEMKLLDRDTVDNLDSFSAGVNAYLHTHSPSQLSLEYTLLAATGLDYHPEDWTGVDSLAWLKAMAWDLQGNTADELNRAILAAHLSPEQIAELYPAYPYGTHPPIVTQSDRGTAVAAANRTAEQATTRPGSRGAAGTPAGALAALTRARAAFDDLPAMVGRGSGVGSNAWAVAGTHTTTGKPLLANDPHLETSVPGIWYQMGLHCRTVSEACPYDVSGFTFAGVPGVILGHNAKVAWGFTNLEADVSDLYLEKIDGHTYLYDGKYVPLKERDETIEIAGEKPFVYTVRSTRRGPLMSDVSPEWSTAGANADAPSGAPDAGNGYAVSIRWTGLVPSRTMNAVFDIDQAKNFSSFRKAARDFAGPSQNLVYADTAGHIGYQAPGLIPIRKPGSSGDAPEAGWDPDVGWKGYVPFRKLPWMLDPKSGYVVTANQAVTGPDYPVYLGDSWDYGYRSKRIADLLSDRTKAGGKLGVADLARIQLDDWNGLAPALVPRLEAIELTGFDAIGQKLFQGWNYRQPVDSAAAAYFNAVYRQILRLTFDDDLPKSEWPDSGSRWWAVLTDLLQNPDSHWWDDRSTEYVVERRDDILKQAMLDARDELIRLQDRNPENWRWGDEHVLNLQNQTVGSGGSAIANRLLNRGGFEVGGSDNAVNATGWDAGTGYAVDWAPSMRSVMSLADFDDSRWINLTGASGHAFSDHYTDQTELWAAGKTLPFLFSRAAIEADEPRSLILTPGG
ncbi:MAG: penicillin acylase family protein [Nocardioidaceae bacterium]